MSTIGISSIMSCIVAFIIITIGQWYYGMKIESLESQIVALETANKTQEDSIKSLEDAIKKSNKVIMSKDEKIRSIQENLETARKNMDEASKNKEVADWNNTLIPDGKLDVLRKYANGSADKSVKGDTSRSVDDTGR